MKTWLGGDELSLLFNLLTNDANEIKRATCLCLDSRCVVSSGRTKLLDSLLKRNNSKRNDFI